MSDHYFANQKSALGNQNQILQGSVATAVPKLTHAQELENKANDLRSGISEIRSRIGSLAARLGVPTAPSVEKATDAPIPPGILTSVAFTVQGSQNIVSDIFQLLNEIEQRI